MSAAARSPARPRAKALRPVDLPELTSARGIAASLVVLYHVDAYSGGVIGSVFPTAVVGRLAVDFFFVLSGFVLTHVYDAAWACGRYSHRDFLTRRIARIWPLHIVCLLGVGAIVGAGMLVGMTPPWKPTLSSFLAYATLLNAVGLTLENAWNQPSWSVGAEWTAYLCFPLYLAVASAIRPAAAKLLAAIAAVASMWIVVQAISGADLFTLKDAGALRIAPSFFAGVVLRQILQTGIGTNVPASELGRMTVETAAVLALSAAIGAPPLLLWAGLLGIVYLLALRSLKAEGGALRSRPAVWFGEISYALYLVHAPVLMVTFGAGAKLLGFTGPGALVALGGASALIAVAVAAAAHEIVERPAQRLILAAAPPAPRPAAQQG